MCVYGACLFLYLYVCCSDCVGIERVYNHLKYVKLLFSFLLHKGGQEQGGNIS